MSHPPADAQVQSVTLRGPNIFKSLLLTELMDGASEAALCSDPA